MKRRRRLPLIAALVTAAAFVGVFVPGAISATGNGSLAQPDGIPPTGDVLNKQHWKALAGTTITGYIENADDAVPGTGGCADDEVEVLIKSSDLGNTQLCGTLSDNTITFLWDVPEDGCNTTIVAYRDGQQGGQEEVMKEANNALIPGGDGGQPAGFGIVDSDGNVLTECGGGGGPEGPSITKDAVGSYDDTVVWDIDKSADADTVYSAGGGESGAVNYTVTVSHGTSQVSNVVVSGTITVTNPNSDPLPISGVTDQLSDGTVCDVTGGDATSLDPGDTSFPYTCSPDSPSEGLTNTATVSWDGEPVSFTTLPISFTANEIDECTTVNDTNPNGPQGQEVCVGDANPTVFNYSETFNDDAGTCTDHENTASFVTGDTEATGEAKTTVKDCQGADLTVSKTATPSYDLKYAWTIDKSVDKTFVRTSGSTATFNYSIAVSHDAGTPSNWKVTGTITVNNPNDWQSVTLTDLSDVIDNGGNCTVDTSGGLTIAASGSKDYPYECTYSSAPSPDDFENTATATWDSAAAHTPNSSADGSATGAFSTPTNVTDECVNVSDSYAGSLGTVCVGGANPTTLTYSRTVNVPQNACADYDNTASFTTNDNGATGSDSVTVRVCGPNTGEGTMGFWQNKNGQDIIKGGASTAGVCNSGTYLRTFNPFKDLSATASCSAVATYVTNVIKAANATGASMNAMLKAQMLSTALDVFFGKVNGNNKVDLTYINKPIGSASYENTSAAFGGSTCLTVNQLLAYASSQSNSGGSAWYGQVKATQELAKDTFDAINNGKTFSC
jgi:hypothetical protein